MSYFKKHPGFKIALAANLGIGCGFGLMLLIAIYEDDIEI